MAVERNTSPVSTSSSTSTHPNQNPQLSAIVKGAGPAGLASAVALAQSGFKVHVIEKRPERPMGKGRQNMVAIRPEGLRRLEELGALSHLLDSRDEKGNNSHFTRITAAATKSEIDGNVFPWDLKRYPPAEPDGFVNQDDPAYEVPESLGGQFPSSFVTLGDLEDSLRQAALKLGVEFTYDATITANSSENSSDYSVTIDKPSEASISIERPNLIVFASGKNDNAIPSQLSFTRRTGVLLEASNLPDLASSNPRALKLSESADHEIETQFFSVFGIKYINPTSDVGTLDHVIRKYTTSAEAKTFQPVTEIQMNHSESSHVLLHLPRSNEPLKAHSSELEEYVLSRLNARLAPEVPFKSVQQLKDMNMISWGDPLQPVTVETFTAPQFAYGTNVILVGDAAISCSPSSGIGADIGMTADSKSVSILAEGLAKISRGTGGESDKVPIMKLLDDFNLRKAESAVLWSQGSRLFYVTQEQASDILRRLRNEEKQEKQGSENGIESTTNPNDVSVA